jgi:hypothetical protein
VLGFLWAIHAYRAELAAIGIGESHVEDAIIRKLYLWAATDPRGAPVVVFGDSLNVCMTPPDTKRIDRVARWMELDLERSGTPVELLDLTHPGLQPMHAFGLLDDALSRPVRLVVMEVNVRSFIDPSLRPGAERIPQLSRKLSLREAARVRSNLALDGMTVFDPIVYRLEERYQLLYAFEGLRQAVLDRLAAIGAGVRDALGLRTRPIPSFKEVARRENATYLLDYAGHPVAGTLRAIREALHERGVPVLFYVAPMDVERLTATGQYDRSTMVELLEQLRRAIGATPDEWLDLHEALPGDVFRDKQNHLKIAGCEQIGALLGKRALERLEQGAGGG